MRSSNKDLRSSQFVIRNVAILALALLASRSPLCAATPSEAQNWPRWRGPLATGEAPSAKPPIKWSETENVKWKVKVPGAGAATPIVWQDRLFVQSAIPTGKKPAADAGAAGQVADNPPSGSAQADSEAPRRGEGGRGGGRGGFGSVKPSESQQFVLLCLDRASGKTLWQQVAREEFPHEGHHRDHGFSSGSPVTDGKHVYAYFGSRGLYCYDLDGNLKWSKDLGKMRTRNGFGEGTSPTLAGDTIVVNWDHEEDDDFVVAFNAISGKELWRTKRDEPTTWSTPLVVEHGGKQQVVIAATNRIRSYELATGKLIWECSGLFTNAIPSPVAMGDLLFATSGYKGSALLAIRLGRSGDLSDSDAVAWRLDKSTPYVPSPLLYNGRLYFYASNNAILSCHRAETGSLLFGPQRVEGLAGVYASPVGADGRVYLLGRDGAAVVIRDADAFEVLATNKLDERFEASPAMVGGEMFLRGHEFLYCIAEQ